MSIDSLRIQNFRCFNQQNFKFHPQLNIIFGNNGSGKTALLEALCILGLGRSFRTRETTTLIQLSQQEFIISSSLDDEQVVSIYKHRTQGMSVKINNNNCLRLSELARLLPSQVIYQDLFEIIDAGPVFRRQLLDWGLFHVKPDYFSYLQKYKKALKQRNQLLKSKSHYNNFKHWNYVLSELALKIDSLRSSYLNELKPLFKKYLNQLEAEPCDIQYIKGWDRNDQGLSLEQCLEDSHESDLLKQYTQHGIHHADLLFQTSMGQAKKYLSRGQQKIILIALRLSQAELFGKKCIFIWDDIFSELDNSKIENLLKLIVTLPGQFFITTNLFFIEQKLEYLDKQLLYLK